jgi:glutathione reductase (NADPH)
MYDLDLFVIGAGSGGVRAARIAAGLGAKVAMAEEYLVGGTCVVRGCIPKKLFVYASHFADEFEVAESFGWSIPEPKFDWPTLIANKDREINRLVGLYEETLGKAGVEINRGRAVLKDAHTLEMADGSRLSTETILVATGGAPFKPDIPGIEHAITSNEAFHLDNLPGKILIAGAGYIAVEFAGIFHGLGSEVILSYRRDKVLRGFDEDLRDHLTAEMKRKGINFLFETNITSIEKGSDGLTAKLDDGVSLNIDAVMIATGRHPNTKGIGVEEAGVQLASNGAVAVDEYSRTNIPNIYAVGDVTDRHALTPVAIKEGHAFALTVYGGTPVSPEHDNVPSAVFSQPPIGTVGLSEAEAREKFAAIDVFRSEFRPLKYTLGGSGERALIKLVVEREGGRVVGAHMIGPDAPEIIQGIGIAVKNGLTKAQFDHTLAIHPSSAEEFVLMPTPVQSSAVD